MKRGFTLIEALTVISIIGILASLGTFVVSSAQRQARDAKRRSDLTAIGVAFQARFESKTCSNAADLRRYPGYSNPDNSTEWHPVTELIQGGNTDTCGAFTEFLTIIPTDSKFDATYPYKFNLSNKDSQIGKHFRLATKLERTLTPEQVAERARNSRIWIGNFGGKVYPGSYTYFIGD